MFYPKVFPAPNEEVFLSNCFFNLLQSFLIENPANTSTSCYRLAALSHHPSINRNIVRVPCQLCYPLGFHMCDLIGRLMAISRSTYISLKTLLIIAGQVLSEPSSSTLALQLFFPPPASQPSICFAPNPNLSSASCCLMTFQMLVDCRDDLLCKVMAGSI